MKVLIWCLSKSRTTSDSLWKASAVGSFLVCGMIFAGLSCASLPRALKRIAISLSLCPVAKCGGSSSIGGGGGGGGGVMEAVVAGAVPQLSTI